MGEGAGVAAAVAARDVEGLLCDVDTKQVQHTLIAAGAIMTTEDRSFGPGTPNPRPTTPNGAGATL